MTDERVKGITKWFNPIKGYGFIVIQDSGKDVFVHYSALQGEGYKALHEGDLVEFTLVNEEKGLQATDVVVLPKE